jgi:GTP diphosphokinase / guanosine-3',5'-bis(diphosphate) 3'-diphosphatase
MKHDLEFLLQAAMFAAEKHRKCRRKGADASPYINHPIDVANLVAGVGGITDARILAAAILHDTVEDTATKPEEIADLFGADVSAFVAELTDDKRLPKAERKRLQVEHARELSPGAKTIKLADKISNVNEVIDNPPADWPIERRREYLTWAEAVVAGCRGTNAALERRFDESLQRGLRKLVET